MGSLFEAFFAAITAASASRILAYFFMTLIRCMLCAAKSLASDTCCCRSYFRGSEICLSRGSILLLYLPLGIVGLWFVPVDRFGYF